MIDYNEIIQVLECCGKYHVNHKEQPCEHCPFNDKAKCVAHLIDNIIGFINRQQAEIERLEYTILEEHSECDRLSLHVSNLLYELENTKTEAIKEYREKAAIKLAENARSDYWHWIDDILYEVEKELIGDAK